MNSFFQLTALGLAIFSALMSILVFRRLQQPTSFAWWGIKVFVSALAPFLAILGALSVILGALTGSLWIILPGLYSTAFFLLYLHRINASITSSSGLRAAFGPDWENRIADSQKATFLPKPATLWLPAVPEASLIQNIPFCTIPETDRQLLCDLWLPPKSVKPSGLAFIYFHGSAWCVLDKDFGTRPFFQHLAAQGHTIMDVAYRLFPETDMTGMVNDVFRAIAWMKTNADVYGILPDGIVIGGASAGGHLALLAAYNRNNPNLIPAELQGTDLSVQAVISEYGPPDLEALYYHTGQHITTRESPNKMKSKPAPTPQWIQKMMGKNFHRLGMDKDGSAIGVLPVILGCHPDECPDVYASFSPLTYVHKDCPPTLLIQGMHDLITPVEAARQLFNRLTQAGVPAVLYLLPQTDHAFDLILPRISPVAHTAFYAIERFLALQVKKI